MSKFDKVFEAREAPVPAKQKSVSAGKAAIRKEKHENIKTEAVETIKAAQETATKEPQKQRGRPKAKRSDPNFIGFTTYIRKDTHLKVKIALLQEGNGRELSQLVEDLLAGWVKTK